MIHNHGNIGASSSSSTIHEAASSVELFIKCRALKNKDTFSLSDPVVVLFVPEHPRMRGPSIRWRELGRTEMIKDNLNPEFSETFTLDFHFEEIQELRFDIYDIDSRDQSLRNADFLGSVRCTLGEICGTPSQTLTRKIMQRDGRSHGVLIVHGQECNVHNKDEIVLHLHGEKLAKKDLFGLSDPYLCIFKQSRTGNKDWVKVFQTETIKWTLNPKWKAETVTMAKLCDGNEHTTLKAEVWDWNRSSADSYIGAAMTTLADLKDRITLELVDNRKGKNKRRGRVVVRSCTHIRNHSFLEYIAGGCEITLACAIDFTASNAKGTRNNPRSLHYVAPNYVNDYEAAIRAIGDIVAQYTTNPNYPSFGFGARLSPQTPVSHCFALNGNAQAPECRGVDGILHAYKQALRSVQLYGPTWFHQIINAASNIANQHVSQNSQEYFILLIITDGIINDMDETIKEVIRASRLPLSIIIVGVGDADFTNMDVLDSDDRLLSRGNEVAARDIVQFVPFNKFKSYGPALLAKAVLEEVPEQLTSFFKVHKITPNPVPEYVYKEPQSFHGQPPIDGAENIGGQGYHFGAGAPENTSSFHHAPQHNSNAPFYGGQPQAPPPPPTQPPYSNAPPHPNSSFYNAQPQAPSNAPQDMNSTQRQFYI